MTKAGKLIYITGGARSGKSSFAERQALRLSGHAVTYLATAQAFDGEMRARIERHQSDRPAEWITLEEPLDVVAALQTAHTPTVLLDCLSLWVSNLMLAEREDGEVLARVDDLLRHNSATLIVVSNEVGLGIVPDNALARRYRDLLGWANQHFAAAADEAHLLVSGLPLRLK
ncbi:bifunctional adenosylcobinamide kinase/adenosylcobinamide-phosphate guanylyltransferase (plasmid) [Deinococcus psychrotolerans]|uniref:Adenosylcobinamide kinase n=1 Tax=Deinococcus psychrotolerans TaxID=2489213 RepID=A0A3G8YRG9_9DEIO|nr:bifunctional adenosylcobinamide kinase/adenosylcobinamide-phosphate guanylyltransferase [Deinococcus psychrotolerans]